jgi:hypothetical protein
MFFITIVLNDISAIGITVTASCAGKPRLNTQIALATCKCRHRPIATKRSLTASGAEMPFIPRLRAFCRPALAH